MLPGLYLPPGLVVPPVRPTVLTRGGNKGEASPNVTTTFTSVAYGGPPEANRTVVALIGGGGATSGTMAADVTAVTIGGIPANKVAARSDNTETIAAIFYAAVPTGTSGNVVVTFDRLVLRAMVELWSLNGPRSPHAPFDFGTAAGVGSGVNIGVVAGGVVLGASMDGGSLSHTWTNATKALNLELENNVFSTAYALPQTTDELFVSSSGNINNAKVIASWR